MSNTLQQVVTLSDVHAHLRVPPTYISDDQQLQGFITAATEVIKAECGDIVPIQYDEYYDGGELSVWTRHVPILSVSNVEEGWGWTNYELDYIQVNSVNETSMFAYSIDNPEVGEITRRSGGNINIPFMRGDQNIRITYTSGFQEVPGNVRLAALELIAHWWQGSQQRSVGATTSSSYDAVAIDFTRSQGLTGLNSGVPYRVLELLKPNRRLPIIG